MTKSEFITQLTELDDIESKASAERILAHAKSIIKSELAAGNEVALGTDFGTFKPTTRSARSGVNPSTGAKIQIAASNTVKFNVSASFKRELNS